MELSPVALEVNGGLSNPIVLATMGGWLVVLLAALLPLAQFLGRRRRIRHPFLGALALGLGLIVPTQFVRVSVVTWVYQHRNPNIAGVGFWGGEAPVLVAGVGAVCCLVAYRRAAGPVA